MNFTITTKSQLKNIVAKKHSDLAYAFDCIICQDGLENDSRFLLLPSEEWKELGADTRCTDVVISSENGKTHVLYVSTCHIKNVVMEDCKVKPTERVMLGIIPIVGRDEGARDTIYAVFELPNTTGKLNHLVKPDELYEVTHCYDEETQEIINDFREWFFERVRNEMKNCG